MKIQKRRSKLQLKFCLTGHTEPVICLTSSSSWGVAVSGSKDTTAIIWDITRYLYIFLSIYLSIYLFIYPCICLSIYIPIHLYMYISIIYLIEHLSIHSIIHLYICTFIYQIYLGVCLSI